MNASPFARGRRISDRRGAVVAAAFAATAAIWTIGCARIDSYQVAPLHVCAGDTVTVQWRATGDVRLTAAPPIEGVGQSELKDEGTTSVHVQQSVRLTLKVSRLFSEQSVDADVVVAQGSPPRPFGGLAHCDDAAHAAEVTFPLGADDFAPGARAGRVSNPYARPLVVIHRDRTDTIAPHGTSDHFADREAAGPWTLRLPVGVDESCDNVMAAQADRLAVTIKLDCGG